MKGELLVKLKDGASGVVTAVHAGTPECAYVTDADERSNYRCREIPRQFLNTTYVTSARSIGCGDIELQKLTNMLVP